MRIHNRALAVRSPAKWKRLTTAIICEHLSEPFVKRAASDMKIKNHKKLSVEQLRLKLAALGDKFRDWVENKRYFCNTCASDIIDCGTVGTSWNSIGSTFEPVPELECLSFTERRIIGLVSVAAELHLKRSYEQHGLSGCVVMSARERPVYTKLLIRCDVHSEFNRYYTLHRWATCL